MSNRHFAVMQTIVYRNDEPILNSRVEYAVPYIAKCINIAAESLGRPAVIETVNEKDGSPYTTFRFPIDGELETIYAVEGLTANELRAICKANTKPAAKPATKHGCSRCGNGNGTYYWGAVINGVPQYSGVCFKCWGSGDETKPGKRP